jgi:hypothetical protein
MKQIFKLTQGEITFETDRILISDDSKNNNMLVLLNAVLLMIFGLLNLIRYFLNKDEILLWGGSAFFIINLVIIVTFLLRSNQNEILFKDIKSIKVQETFRWKFLDIKLKNNKLRRINGLENIQELREYLQSNTII